MMPKVSNVSDQMGHPLDHRHVTKRAHWQSRTNVADAIRGPHVQSRTHAWNAIRENFHHQSLRFCTYNPQSISDLQQEDFDTMLVELENMKWDVVGLSATQIKESLVEVLPSGHYLFNSGNNSTRTNGVGFLVNKAISLFISDYNSISDRLAVLTLQGKENKIHLIQVYFPTTTHPDEDVDKLYDQIQNIIDNTPKRDFLFIMGDFNARVGGLHNIYPKCVGKHTIGTANDRGERLAGFCTANNLCITNTFFQKRRLHTWNHPNGTSKGQIDFILSPSKFHQNVTNTSVLNTPTISDHKMVRAEVNIKYIWQKPKSSFKKYNLSALKDPTVASSFELELKNRFLPLIEDSSPSVEDFSNAVNRCIIDTADKLAPPVKSPPPSWMSNDTIQAINNKKDVRKKHGDRSIHYRVAKAETKKLVKLDKINHLNDALDETSNLPPDKQFFLAMKKLKTKKRNISWGVKDKNGKVLTSKDEILERWATFYEELYDDPNTCDPLPPDTENPIPSILKSEVASAIDKLSSGKSPGIDSICAEFLKAGGDAMVQVLTKLFNLILETGEIPSTFKKALIVVLFKKDDRSECKNYRPISLLSHVYKLFMTVIGRRITDDLYATFPDTQAAYQPSRGTIEQIFALSQIIEKSIEFNKPVYFVFIDFTKAFDSIKLDKLWSILDKTSLNKNYINLLKAVYDDSQASIKTDLGNSRFVNIKKGVKQGDMLSAILFCVALAAVILKTEDSCQSGYPIGGRVLSNLSYADDIAVVNDCLVHLQSFVDALSENAQEIGLQINLSKTDCMTTDKLQTAMNIKIYGQPLKQVTEFIYLGHKLSSTGNQEVALKHRIGLGWAAFNNNSTILKSKRVPIAIKVKTYLLYVLPVVLHGLDCITWTQKLSQRIEVFQNHVMRFITGHRLIDRTRITTLRSKTSLPPLFDKIKCKTLKLYGHIKRSTTGVSKICLEGMVEGKRSRGKPKTRWRDNILSWSTLPDWLSIGQYVQNRKFWRQLSVMSSQSAHAE